MTEKGPVAKVKGRSPSPDAKQAARDYPLVAIASRAELRDWLDRSHGSLRGAWIVTLKPSSGGSLKWSDIVEEALCVGWIDSLPRKVDEAHTSLLLTPRKATSKWSAKNKAHVADLERRGLMKEGGAAAVARSKMNGTWDALDDVTALLVPDDLSRALDVRAGSRAHWESFPPSVRRGILEWITNAKRAETRAKRIEETARLAQENRRANQWAPSRGQARKPLA